MKKINEKRFISALTAFMMLCAFAIGLIHANYSQFVSAANSFSTAPMLAGGRNFVAGLKQDGTVLFAADNEQIQENIGSEVASWNGITHISASYGHIVGLKSNGTAVAAGNNDSEQCDVADWSDIVQLETSPYVTVGLKSDGTVLVTGVNVNLPYNKISELNNWRNIVQIRASENYIFGLTENGTVLVGDRGGLGNIDSAEVLDWTDIIRIETGYNVTIGYKSDGTIVTTKAYSDGNILPSFGKSALEDASVIGEIGQTTYCVTQGAFMSVFSSDMIFDATPEIAESELQKNPVYQFMTNHSSFIDVATKGSSLIGLTSDKQVICSSNTSEVVQQKVKNWNLFDENAFISSDLENISKIVLGVDKRYSEEFDLNGDGFINSIDLTIGKYMLLGGEQRPAAEEEKLPRIVDEQGEIPDEIKNAVWAQFASEFPDTDFSDFKLVNNPKKVEFYAQYGTLYYFDIYYKNLFLKETISEIFVKVDSDIKVFIGLTKRYLNQLKNVEISPQLTPDQIKEQLTEYKLETTEISLESIENSEFELFIYRQPPTREYLYDENGDYDGYKTTYPEPKLSYNIPVYYQTELWCRIYVDANTAEVLGRVEYLIIG